MGQLKKIDEYVIDKQKLLDLLATIVTNQGIDVSKWYFLPTVNQTVIKLIITDKEI